jgi:hypothetical protein
MVSKVLFLAPWQWCFSSKLWEEKRESHPIFYPLLYHGLIKKFPETEFKRQPWFWHISPQSWWLGERIVLEVPSRPPGVGFGGSTMVAQNLLSCGCQWACVKYFYLRSPPALEGLRHTDMNKLDINLNEPWIIFWAHRHLGYHRSRRAECEEVDDWFLSMKHHDKKNNLCTVHNWYQKS